MAVASMLLTASSQAFDPADAPFEGLGSSGVEMHRPFWRGSGPTRAFAAAELDLQILNFQPKLQLGYGKPHYKWFGVEGYSRMSLSGGRMYAGLRGAIPHLSIRAGLRYDFPLDQFFLEPQDDYDREDVEAEDLAPSKYLTAEAQIGANSPFPGGSIFGVVNGYALFNTPEDVYVFEEALKIVVDPPWVWRARAGYLYHVGWQGTLRIGAGAELLHVVNRDAFIVRAGPLVSVALTHHLEASGAIMIVAHSPDELGLVGADLGQLGLRYRWATGDRWPEFP
jgi:hypothetical protein